MAIKKTIQAALRGTQQSIRWSVYACHKHPIAVMSGVENNIFVPKVSYEGGGVKGGVSRKLLV